MTVKGRWARYALPILLLPFLEEREIRLAALRRALKEGEESGRTDYSLKGLLDELDSDSSS